MNLSEKYRPKNFDSTAGQKDVIDALKNKKELNDHLLFSGPPGVGKTTVAYILAAKFNLPIKEFNASDERGIDTIRGEVKRLARTRGKRIILLDESDQLCLTGDTKILRGPTTYRTLNRLDELNVGYRIAIPSVNPETLEIEEDFGRLVDSGYADFYRVEFENNTHIDASLDHPFFKIKDKKLEEIKLKDLSVGDTIVELDKMAFGHCETCGKSTLNVRFCSIKCQDKGHSIEVSGNRNPRYGEVSWNKGLIKETDPRVAKQASFGEKNGNFGGTFHGPSFWHTATPERIREVKDQSSKRMSRPYSERFGDKEAEQRAKRGSSNDINRAKTNMWVEKKLSGNHIDCEDCGRQLNTNHRNHIDGVYIHHIDGNSNNHIPENIRFVCPFCHNMVEHDANERFLEKGHKIVTDKDFDRSKCVEGLKKCNEDRKGKTWEEIYGVEKAKELREKASRSRGTVHNGIKITSIKSIGTKKAWNISMEKNKNFILSNGVVTHNTSDAQQSLRRIMEKTESIFILTGNDTWKIVDAIKSRCAVYDFKPLSDYDLMSQIIKICQGEKIEITKESQAGLLELMSQAGGDMRKAINLLTKILDKDAKITASTVKSFIKPQLAKEALKSALNGDFEKAQRQIEDAFLSSKQSPHYIINELFEAIGTLKDNNIKIKLFRELARTESACKTQADPISPLIQLVGFIATAYLVPHLSAECPVLRGDNV